MTASDETEVQHIITLDQDGDGWDFARCKCGWIGPPCPDKEIAADFYTDHVVEEARDLS